MSFRNLIRTSLRKAPSQSRAQETVEAVLQATTRILKRDGNEKLNTNRIAEVAGISIGSLYQYFPGKEAILAMLVRRHLESKFAIVDRQLSKNPQAKIETVIHEIIDALVVSKGENSRFEQILEEQIPKLGALKAMKQLDDIMVSKIVAYLSPYKDEIRMENLDRSVFLIIMAVKGVLLGTNLERPELFRGSNRAGLVGELNHMVLSYLRA